MRRALLLAVLAACGGGGSADPDAAAVPDASTVDPDAPAIDPDAAPPGPPPAVIVLIGDGMGQGQMDAASLYATGATDGLAMQALPFVGEVRTGSPSGITDSAAAATVMATGVYTYNGNVGVDRADQPVETIVERAQQRGWATGVVTTAALTHATPAGFTAHVDSRAEQALIAAQQVMTTQPDVMLGGGAQYFLGLDDELTAAGYTQVATADALAAAVPTATRLFGAFAPDHMTYVAERASDTTEPTLEDLAVAALAVLDRDPDGFFVMIEGGRIDHGGHANNLTNAVQETLAFDTTVATVTAWARARGNVTVLVTADHETGGLQIVTPAAAGTYPEVTWRWTDHTNARVAIFGEGPGTELVDGTVVDHRWVHAIARARVDGDAFVEPGREPIPDGELAELRHVAATQTLVSGFGPGFNQLDTLRLDATAAGLFIGIDGVFEWTNNAVEVWIDVDFGASTGPAGLHGVITDAAGTADVVLAGSSLSAPPVAGFGVDVVAIAVGGSDPKVEQLRNSGGLRGVRAPYGDPADLGWGHAAINYGAVRTTTEAVTPVAGHGMEVFVPWVDLYPPTGVVPVGARVAIGVILVNSDGGFTSNQALPPFPGNISNPGRNVVPLPGVVVYDLDADADGIVDGDTPPVPLP